MKGVKKDMVMPNLPKEIEEKIKLRTDEVIKMLNDSFYAKASSYEKIYYNKEELSMLVEDNDHLFTNKQLLIMRSILDEYDELLHNII